MKKVLLSICIVALLALLFSAVGGKTETPAEGEPHFTTVSEAAFSMRSSGAENATSRLVGSFTGEHGQKLVFDGVSEVKRVAQNLSFVTGTYSLLQAADGAAILQMEIGDTSGNFTFSITSPEGEFIFLNDTATTEIYTPVPQ